MSQSMKCLEVQHHKPYCRLGSGGSSVRANDRKLSNLVTAHEVSNKIKERAGVDGGEENIQEESDNGLDMDEDMMLAGLTMFEAGI